MRICIEESTYEGTPIEILTQLRALHFNAGTFDGTEGYIRYMQNTIRRMTEQPSQISFHNAYGLNDFSQSINLLSDCHVPCLGTGVGYACSKAFLFISVSARAYVSVVLIST